MPSSISSDNIDKVLSLTTYAPALLGSNFQRVKLLGILDYRSVYPWIDPAATHANVFPSLPPGTPNNHTKYSYAKFEFPNGKIVILGLPWINDSTVEVIEEVTFNVVIRGEDITKFQTIQDALLNAGINDFTISH